MRRELRRLPAFRTLVRWRVLRRTPRAWRERPGESFRYLLRGREIWNFTYDLANLDELVAVVADLLHEPVERIKRYAGELGDDRELDDRLSARLRSHPRRESTPLYGSRVGYYCIVRALRPAIAVETGTHDGLGAAVLLRALERNEEEGSPGTLLAFDVEPDSGWLVDPALGARMERHIGDTKRTLAPALDGRAVGVFVHDSLKTYEHERFELETALRHADRRLLLVTDDARATGALPELCAREKARYRAFRERPLDHFWPGNVVGFGLVERQ